MDPFGTNPLVVPIGIAIGEAIVDAAIGLGAATAIVELGNQALENRGQGQGKGERGQSGTPAATENPFKHIKPHPTDPDKVIQTNPHDGKPKEIAKPEGYDEFQEQKKKKKKNRKRRKNRKKACK